jgi:hypothetical protein
MIPIHQYLHRLQSLMYFDNAQADLTEERDLVVHHIRISG